MARPKPTLTGPHTDPVDHAFALQAACRWFLGDDVPHEAIYELAITAWHEAMHLMAAVLSGEPVRSVEIQRIGPRRLGRVQGVVHTGYVTAAVSAFGAFAGVVFSESIADQVGGSGDLRQGIADCQLCALDPTVVLQFTREFFDTPGLEYVVGHAATAILLRTRKGDGLLEGDRLRRLMADLRRHARTVPGATYVRGRLLVLPTDRRLERAQWEALWEPQIDGALRVRLAVLPAMVDALWSIEQYVSKHLAPIAP